VEAAGDQLVLSRIGQHVARDLFDRELIERHVLVERVDDPVAVLPHDARQVLFVALRIGVAREIEPGTRPALAVVGRGEQAIDQSLVRRVAAVARRVGGDFVDLLRRGRQPDQIERDPPNERFQRRLTRRREPLMLEAREHEPVDRRARPVGPFDGRQLRPDRRAVGPVLRSLLRGSGRRGRQFGARRQRRALIDPRPDKRDLHLRQGVLVLRHPVFPVEAEQPPDDRALLAVAGNDDRAVLAALHDRRGGIQTQVRFLLLGVVALVAVLGEDGLDVAREVDRLRAPCRGRGGERREDNADEEAKPDGHSAEIAASKAFIYPKVKANACAPRVSPAMEGTWSGISMPS
jgi:hypothetical protein